MTMWSLHPAQPGTSSSLNQAGSINQHPKLDRNQSRTVKLGIIIIIAGWHGWERVKRSAPPLIAACPVSPGGEGGGAGRESELAARAPPPRRGKRDAPAERAGSFHTLLRGR